MAVFLGDCFACADGRGDTIGEAARTAGDARSDRPLFADRSDRSERVESAGEPRADEREDGSCGMVVVCGGWWRGGGGTADDVCSGGGGR